MLLIKNSRASYDYQILKTYLAGIQLTGAEVKSLRQKTGSLRGSFVKIINHEAFLINAQISPYKFAHDPEYDPKRTRKLLLKKKQIYQLKQATEKKGISLVALSFKLINNKIKLKIGVGRGKKVFEKRAKIKKRTLKRNLARKIKAGKIKV
ncbi:MAG: SsrA-binding protein SmpB [Candidatus Pacebacteria bacterium]|nr:SsrA-binding protein SmpB [Candidatus Paceibacterota bacterium]